MVAGEQQGAAVSESKQREEEFSQILEAIKRSEEEEVRSVQLPDTITLYKALITPGAVSTGCQQGGALTGTRGGEEGQH